MKLDLQDIESKIISLLTSTANVKAIYLYGSIITEYFNSESDIDIAVLLDKKIDSLELFELNSSLAKELGKDIDLVQLDLFGKIDPELYWQFNPLYQLDANEQADVDLKKAQTAQIYVDMGVIDNIEQREILQSDEDGPYTGLDMSKDMDAYNDVDVE